MLPLLYLAAMWLTIPTAILLLIYCILIVWYRQAWNDLPDTSNDAINAVKQTTKVTLIIPARNEAANIGNCIKSVLAQTYPAHLLEILVMDDESEDETAVIVEDFAVQHLNIKVIRLKHDATSKAHKKRAIETGIAAAAGALIVATDADCTHPPRWIETLVASYDNGRVFVAAPVIYHTAPTFLSVFQTLDFLSLQGITGASVHRSFHTMCNGANIGYSKNAFHEVNGFAGIDALPTGDDMLLMHKIYKKHPTEIAWLKNQHALVLTNAAPTWRAFFNQRIRWASKAAFYDDKRIFYVLLLVYFLNVALLILGVSAFFSIQHFYYFSLALAIKTIVELWFLIPVATFFKKQKWLWLFPLFQPVHILYTVIAGWLGKFGKYEWKGREISKGN